MRDVDSHSRIEVIHVDECLELLRTAQVGRLAFVNGAASADVLPVNYVLDGDAVVFATATGSKLWSSERGSVAFEVDATDVETQSGWSVVVHGLAQEITSVDAPGLVARLRALPLNPWAGGDRPHLVRIAPRSITGRRVGGRGGPHDQDR
ncbi:MAG TPA: pyridoxamine 5'-phosphate oxidase family protein [Acidimicrobiales bacterium]|nr:pyridoxamine 5'-phosphate oxidase family protein [Acidimicrobiales bacterium]